MTHQPNRRLLLHGSVLILLGLLTGAAIPAFTNPRMALAAHLGAVMSGMLLMVLGLAWPYARLSAGLEKLTHWLLLYSMYVIWVSNVLAAIFGASRMAPIAGAGFEGKPWQETLVTAGLATGALAVLVAVSALVYGFARGRSES